MPEITGLHHLGILVEDLARARNFYESVLGLVPHPARPALPYPGEWYELPDGRQLHLMRLPDPEAGLARPEHGGRDRHAAFAVADIGALQRALERHGVAYTLSKSGRPALFCRDPDGNALEFVQAAAR